MCESKLTEILHANCDSKCSFWYIDFRQVLFQSTEKYSFHNFTLSFHTFVLTQHNGKDIENLMKMKSYQICASRN